MIGLRFLVLSMRRPHSLILIALTLAPMSLQCVAQDLGDVASGASADLQQALAELSTVRSQIEAERLPLARQLTDLESKLSDRKAEFTRIQRVQENQLVELNALKTEAKRQADEVKYIDSLLNEYARAFRSRL